MIDTQKIQRNKSKYNAKDSYYTGSEQKGTTNK